MEFPVIGDGEKYHTVSEAVADGCNYIEIVGDTVDVAIYEASLKERA